MNFIKKLFHAKVAETKDEIRDWSDPDREEVPMPCEEIILTGIDKDLHGKLLGQAVGAGASFDGETATLHGIALSWSFDEPTETLHITPQKHPFYLSCSEIQSKITELVAKAKESV